jgi:hypothetical protein
MYINMNRYKGHLVLIMTAAVISFFGFASVTKHNSPAVPHSKIWDIDFLEAQKSIGDKNITFTFSGQTAIPILKPFESQANLNLLPYTRETQFSLVDTFTINAHPGPPNNGGSAGWAIFFDLIAGPNYNINVTQMSTGSTAPASGSFSVEVITRSGTALGGPVGSGPGSSTAGWTAVDTVPVVQGSTSSGISLIFMLPTILVPAGDTVGVALRFVGAGPRYYGTGSGNHTVYSDTNLSLVTGEVRSAPFTPTGSWFSPRQLTGVIRYVVDSPVGIKGSTEIPGEFKLAQNYPNPFNPGTTIEFSIPEKTNLTLKVYDTDGQLAATLVNSVYTPGTYKVHWNAADFASGVYFYILQAGKFTQTRKMIFIK